MRQLLFILSIIIISLLFINGGSDISTPVKRAAISKKEVYSSWYKPYCDSLRIDSLAFVLALNRFNEIYKERQIKNDSLITIIDFSIPSKNDRLFVFNLKRHELIISSLVSHGMNSGTETAQSFSNDLQSHKSSLGFYITMDTYKGKHGYSLRLEGLDQGLNDNAAKRAIVIHGAEYVNQEYIDKYGRIGRSFGCPALPSESSQMIIDIIKEGCGLFIYHPEILAKY